MTNNIFTKNELAKLQKIYKNLEKDEEFEIMFGGYNKHNCLTLKQFIDILDFLKKYANINKLEVNNSFVV